MESEHKKNGNRPIPSVSLALSGGGARGVIHLGVLQALDENRIKIDAVSGTSIGAIIGALFCAGLSPVDIKKLIGSNSFRKIFHLSWSNNGMLNMDKMIKLLSKFIPKNSFDALNIPFYCCVSNLNKGNYEIINRGNLYKAVAASASIPIIFEPVNITDEFYVDGGLFNNLPTEPLIENYNNIIGVHVNNYQPSEEHNIKTSAERIVSLVIKRNVTLNLKQCDFVIDPFVSKHIGVLDFSDTEFLFNLGYKEAIKLIETKIK